MKWEPEPVDAAVRQVIETSKHSWPEQEKLYAAWDTYRDRFQCDPVVVSNSVVVLLKFLCEPSEGRDQFRAAIEALERWVLPPEDVLLSAPEAQIDAAILKWVGLTDIWQRHQLAMALSPHRVAEECLSAYVVRELFDANSGAAGWVTSVIVRDHQQFRREFRVATARLLQRIRKRGSGAI